MNMDPAIIYHTSSLTINGPEIKEFIWDFEIPPRSKIQKNIESVCFGGFPFSGLQFTTGFLAELDHQWSIHFFSNQINATIAIPSRDLNHRYTVQDSFLLFVADNYTKSTQVLKFGPDEENYHHGMPLRKTWTSIWTNKDGCWNDSVNRIRIIFKISRETSGHLQSSQSSEPESETSENIFPENKAVVDTSELLMNLHLSDITLHCKGEDFPCHRFELAARAPKLHDMVSQLISEQFGTVKLSKTSRRVVIPDIEPQTLKELLKFIYCGNVMVGLMSGDAQLELLKLAAKFGLQALQILCEQEIGKKVTVENCMEMLEVATATKGLGFEMRLLKERAVQVLKINRRIVFKDRETFKNFIRDHEDIAFEIMNPFLEFY